MKDIKKYQGVIPAFYACYDAEGNISTEGVKALTRHLIAKGVKGIGWKPTPRPRTTISRPRLSCATAALLLILRSSFMDSFLPTEC